MDGVVISGISGRFPQSDNIWQFRDHLLNGDDVVTEDISRWPLGLWGLPRRNGKLNDLSKFDANFFGVHAKQANAMAPQMRMLLEIAYEAIFDAGINPETLRGSNTGVFIGLSSVESEEILASDPETINGYEVTGFQRCMFSNRISFTFDFNGPSMTIDAGYSSGLTALNQALRAFENGDCDACVVGGSNLCVNPISSLKFQKLGVLATDGKCRSFDSEGGGYVRSEAVVALFLQREKSAKRVYAGVVHCKVNNDGYKVEGPTFPSGKMQERLLRQIYDEAHIDPADVVYVEADGSGTRVGDTQELAAIYKVFCEKRRSPLLVGSVKSNMGHAEAVAGLCGIIKVLIATETGILPGNLHFKNQISEISDEKIKILSKNTEWTGGLVGVSSISFGGLNAHVILRCNGKSNSTKPVDSLEIFTTTGRTKQTVENILSFVQRKNNKDLNNLLLESTQNKENLHHNRSYRGFTLLNSKNAITKTQELPLEKSEIWFVFPGFGCQWQGMGVDLLSIDVFKASILKSDAILKPLDVNLLELMRKATTEVYNDLISCYVMITSIQIALVDLLRHIGVRPDGLIGHSLGETACAYADGCLTHEQTVFASFWRAKSVEDVRPRKGTMAVVVGLTWDEALQLCPAPTIEAVCHNTEKSVTIAGERKAMKIFMEELEERKIFVKEINTLSVAFHGTMIKDAAPKLLVALRQVIPNPKPRSPHWISSSIQRMQQKSPHSRLANAEYFVNNFANKVLFHDAVQKIPENSIVIEVAPHALLTPLLVQSRGRKNVFVPLTNRTETNHEEFLLRNIGKLFINGVDCALNSLRGPAVYPVATGTPSISPLIGWDHGETWDTVPLQNILRRQRVEGLSFDINVESEPVDAYLVGHVIGGRLVFPVAGYLVFAWKAIASCKRKMFDKMAVVLKDVVMGDEVVYCKNEPLKFTVSVSEQDGTFAIREKHEVVCTGRFLTDNGASSRPLQQPIMADSTFLSSKDVYRMFAMKGYDYGPTFQGVVNAKMDGSTGSLLWVGNWVSFVDSMLQFWLFFDDSSDCERVVRVGSVTIDPTSHLQSKHRNFTLTFDPLMKKLTSGGIQLRNIKTTPLPLPLQHPTTTLLEQLQFVSYFDDRCFETLPQLETETSDYYFACINELRTGLTKWSKNSTGRDEKLEKILNHVSFTSKCDISDVDRPLIRHLRDIFALPVAPEPEIREKTNDLFVFSSDDPILDSILHPNFVKPLLDIVVDNSDDGRIVVTEAHAQSTRLARKIVELMENSGKIDVDYVITAHARSELPEGDLSGLYVDTWDVETRATAQNDLVVGRNVLRGNLDRNQGVLKNVMNSVKNGGFALLFQMKGNDPLVQFLGIMGDFEMSEREHLVMLMEIVGFKVIAIRSDGFLYDAFLVRKVRYKESTVLRIDELNYDLWLDELHRLLHLTNTSTDSTLWLVSNDQPTCGILGLVEQIRRNGTGSRVRAIFNSSFTESKSCVDIAKDILLKDLVTNVYRDHKWGFFTLLPLLPVSNSVPTRNANVDFRKKWRESGTRFHETSPNLCHVTHAAINECDVIENRPRRLLGVEFCGRTKNGKRIMGLVATSGLATRVESDEFFSWVVPEGWGQEDAATVPWAYVTAVYALVERGRVEEGERVLVVGVERGEGQAAVEVGLGKGCVVWGVVGGRGGEGKRKVVEKVWKVRCGGVEEVEEFVMRETGGMGVDVVFNLLGDPFLEPCINCLTTNGRILQIETETTKPTTPSLAFEKNVTFHSISIHPLLTAPPETKKKIAKLVQDALDARSVRPLDRTVFDQDQLKDAFDFARSDRNFGKILIRLPEDEKENFVLAEPEVLCHPSKSYLIIDEAVATGSTGRTEVGHFLVEKGAKFLFFASRTEVNDKIFEFSAGIWRKNGVDVRNSVRNLATPRGTNEMLKEAIESQGAVGGIFILIPGKSGIGEKSIYDNKILSMRSLDAASRTLCPSLDWFVVFCDRNSGFPDSAVERMCEKRKFDEFPALVVRCGDRSEFSRETRSGFAVLEIGLLRADSVVVVSSRVLPKLDEAKTKVLDAVADIFGISDAENLGDEESLADLGVDSIIGMEIKRTLEKSYDVTLSAEEIRRLTVGQLRNMSEKMEGLVDAKLWSVVNVINYDLHELVPSDCVIKLNSIDTAKARPLFIIHSIEGNASLYKSMARQLQVPVYGIQLTPSAPRENLTELALFYIREIQKIQQSPPYNLASYCVGCAILFEMALQLQNLYYALDAIRNVMFIDGAHRPVSIPFLQTAEALDQFQEAILSNFVFHFSQIDTAHVKLNLRNLSTLTSKMEFVVDTIVNLNLPLSRDAIKSAVQLFYACAQLARDYTPKEKLKSPVILLRATNNDIVLNKLGIDYSLGKVCRAPVKVEVVVGEHETFLQDSSADRLVRLINKLLM